MDSEGQLPRWSCPLYGVSKGYPFDTLGLYCACFVFIYKVFIVLTHK